MVRVLISIFILISMPMTIVKDNIEQNQLANVLYNNIPNISKGAATNIAKNSTVEHLYTKEELKVLHKRALATNLDKDWYAYNYALSSSFNK